MRNGIANYEETSPLYGFLKYRRRNVIIKYVPEGCSRLIQGLSHSLNCSRCRGHAPLCLDDPPNLSLAWINAFGTETWLTSTTPSSLQFESPSIITQSVINSPPTTTPWRLPRPKSSTIISYRRLAPCTLQRSPPSPPPTHCAAEN